MLVRIALAAALGGLVLFAATALSWMALPFHGNSLHTLPVPAAQVDGLLHALPASGVYHWPGFPEDPSAPGAMDAMMARMESGPNISMCVVHKEGVVPWSPGQFLGKLLLDVLSAGLAAVLLAVGPAREGYGLRAAFVASLGLVVVTAGFAPEWLWWNYPSGFAWPTVVDHLVGWGLTGLVVAGVVRRE